MTSTNSGMEEAQPTKTEETHRLLFAHDVLSNNLGPDNPRNPENFSLMNRVFISFRAWLFAFTVAIGITCFTAGKNPFVAEFALNPDSPEKFIAAFSLYIFGIAFAPWWSPHVVERIGRTIPYYVLLVINAAFNVGAGRSRTLAGVMVCRFFAGFFGGPCLVILEGTFAELWSAETTNSYYAVQGAAGYLGVGFGPLVGGYLVRDTGEWRWTQYFPACLAAAVLLISLGLPETYNREIPRRQGKEIGKSRKEIVAAQAPPQSGATFAEMAKCTITQPVVMFLTQPVTTLVTLIMFFTWATTFQWLIAVPAALEPAPPMGPGFPVQRVGLAFLSAIIGTILAVFSVVAIDHVVHASRQKAEANDDKAAFASVEFRVIPAMIGIALMTAALFWVGNTIKPSIKPAVPIIGTAFFIWGSGMVTFSIIPYTFDVFQPAPTLSTITSQAVGRILAAGFLPLVILFDITALGPKWGLGTLGFVSLAFWPVPYLLFFFGTKWRMNSQYSVM